ncbi:MAG: metallopeptidase family protein [Candidatus Pacebacteria bacterium]|nr:metallopeptidase family protein [Candidatus Paceibacterota bacterium]
MTLIDFEKLVKEGIDAIPKELLKKLDNVGIVIEDNPTKEQLKKLKVRNDYSLLGLYEGVPKTKRWEYAQVLPDKITIFKNPIERMAQSEEKIKELVKNTVWHEIAHHFGMDEEKVRKSESRRK